jgi:hypothetical protein
MTKDEQIYDIINNFDFDKVHKVMVFLDWKWLQMRGLETPSIPQLKDKAYELLSRVYDNTDSLTPYSLRTGGLCASGVYYEDTNELSLELIFELTGWMHSVIHVPTKAP